MASTARPTRRGDRITGQVARAAEGGFDTAAILAHNDCYRLFAGLGDLVITGATGTNVADIMVALVNF